MSTMTATAAPTFIESGFLIEQKAFERYVVTLDFEDSALATFYWVEKEMSLVDVMERIDYLHDRED